MPLIFIPISTLNYVGVPREKNNQVSGLSNFARNIGGAIGTSLLDYVSGTTEPDAPEKLRGAHH